MNMVFLVSAADVIVLSILSLALAVTGLALAVNFSILKWRDWRFKRYLKKMEKRMKPGV